MITHMIFFTTLVTMLRSVRLYQTRALFKSRRAKINGLEPDLQKNVKSVDSLKVQPHSSGISQSAYPKRRILEKWKVKKAVTSPPHVLLRRLRNLNP